MAEVRNEVRNEVGKEYIEREAVLDKRRKVTEYDEAAFAMSYQAVPVEDIETIPAADVVEVVRCKDCDVPHNKWLGCPNLNGLIPPPDFYCARGKKL